MFDHNERAGSDDSWIYAFDARQIGDKLPIRKLGPWDFRSRTDALSARREIAQNLWKPEKPWTGDRPVTREELAQHTTFDDCWVVIRGKVYDFSEWKDHHPGGPFVARMYGGKDATAEFGEFHSRLAERHMEHFCVGPLVGAPAERAADATEVETAST
jgi:salicylate hydroxylase